MSNRWDRERLRRQLRRHIGKAHLTNICSVASTNPLWKLNPWGQDLLNCWFVCEFAMPWVCVYFSFSTAHTVTTSKRRTTETCFLVPLWGLPACRDSQWPTSARLPSAQLTAVSLPRERTPSTAPHPTEMWETPTVSHTIWDVQIFFSGLEDTDTQFRNLKSKNFKSSEISLFS